MTMQQDRSAAAVIGRVVESVFDEVGTLHHAAVRCHRSARANGRRLRSRDLAGLAPLIGDTLTHPGQIAVGMGLILAPGLLADAPLHLEWWQRESVAVPPKPLRPDLDPASLGFYDYASAPWFAVPRRTGRRHVVGPYVDVHGTGHYVLTLTTPVVDDGTFLGVVGADVTVRGFEFRLLRELPHEGTPVVVLNDEDRVVMSTSALNLTGSLLLDRDNTTQGDVVPGLPWHVRVPVS
jgi:hypothetical protein